MNVLVTTAFSFSFFFKEKEKPLSKELTRVKSIYSIPRDLLHIKGGCSGFHIQSDAMLLWDLRSCLHLIK